MEKVAFKGDLEGGVTFVQIEIRKVLIAERTVGGGGSNGTRELLVNSQFKKEEKKRLAKRFSRLLDVAFRNMDFMV